MKNIVLLFYFFGLSIFAQAPSNDEPSEALNLIVGVNDSENTIIGTNVNATDSSDSIATLPTPECGNYNGGDIWYSATVNDNGYIAIKANTLSTSNVTPLLAIYSGSPNSLNLITCQPSSDTPTVINNRTSGETLFIRIWDRNNDNFGDFEISAFSPEAPINDEPINALNAIVGANIGRSTASSNIGATDSSGMNGIANPTCQNYTGGDVWFSMNVPSSGSFSYTGTVLFGSDFENGGIEIYSGSLGSLSLMECSDFNSRNIITGRSANEKLYIRIWGNNSNNGENLGEFGLNLLATNFSEVNNDEINTAIELSLGSNFEDQKLLASNIDATDSFLTDNTIPDSGCGNYAGGDVWFTTTIGNNPNLFIEVRGSSFNGFGFELNNVVLSIYNGSLNNLTLIECDAGTFFDNPNIFLTDRTPGETLYIRVYDENNQNEGFFDVSAYNAVTNDEPSNAINLINGTSFDDEVIIASNNGATDSFLNNNAIPAPGCGNYNGGDIWFTSSVGNSGNIFFETAIESEGIRANIAVYSGTENNLNLISCQSESFGEASVAITNRMPGETLFVRIWDTNNFREGSFRISAFTFVSLANDEPEGATDLAIDTTIISTNLNATDSFANDNTIPAPGCASYNGGDVWFQVMTNSEGEISVETEATPNSNVDDTGMAIYSGTSSSLNLISCNDDNDDNFFSRIDINGRSANEILFVRVWSSNNIDNGSFSISSFIPSTTTPTPTPPTLINDEASGAIELITGIEFDDNSIIANNVGATDSFNNDNTIPAPGCANYNGGDVWYQVITNSEGEISIETKAAANSNVSDTGMAVYSGTLSSLNLIDCNDDNDDNFFSRLDLTGRAPNENLFVRVWSFNNNEAGEFNISAFIPPSTTTPTPPPTTLINDEVSGAIELTTGIEFDDNSIIANNVSATDSFANDNTIPAPGCASYNGGDVWFQVTTDSLGEISIETKAVANSNVSDTGIAVYSGTLSSLNLIDCNDDNDDNFFSRLDLTGRTPNENLFVRVWSFANNTTGEFEISAFSENEPVLSLTDNFIDNNNNQIRFFPNPVIDYLTIESPKAVIIDLELRNSLEQQFSTISNLAKNKLYLKGLPSGLYFVTIKTTNGSDILKVVKE